MGYTTEFTNSVAIEPPLNEHEISFLQDFNESRRMDRAKGPLYVQGSTGWSPKDKDVRDGNRPPADQPGLWCQWVPTDDGAELEWDGGEKFYNPAEWMKYLVENLLAPTARQYISDHYDEDERLRHFTANHMVNGTIYAQGEDPEDHYAIVVANNKVLVANTQRTWSDPVEIV